MDRREFMLAAGAAGAMLALPRDAAAQTEAAQTAAAPRPRSAGSFYVDGLGGLGNGALQPEPARSAWRRQLMEAIRDRRIDLISTTIGPVGNGSDRYRDSLEAVARWDQIIAANATLIAKVESAADIRAVRAAGKLGLIYNFQDTAALEGDASRVGTFAALGLRVLQLTYNKRGLAGDGCLEPANSGISDFGREVIAAIEASRLLLDLSHAGQRTQAEGIAASTRPLAITHSGCRALADLPRNTHDAEMRALANKGGVFGVYMMPFLRAQGGQAVQEDMLRHLDHAVNVCGEDHVGVGTDNPLMGFTINDESRARQRQFFETRQRQGIAAPGEAADVFNLVEGYNSVDRYDRMASDLRRRGWSAARIDKVLGNNFVRLFGEVWGG